MFRIDVRREKFRVLSKFLDSKENYLEANVNFINYFFLKTNFLFNVSNIKLVVLDSVVSSISKICDSNKI